MWGFAARNAYGRIGSLEQVSKRLARWGYYRSAEEPKTTTVFGRAVRAYTYVLDATSADELPVRVYTPMENDRVIGAKAAALLITESGSRDTDHSGGLSEQTMPLMALWSIARVNIAYYPWDDAWLSVASNPQTFARRVHGMRVECSLTDTSKTVQFQEYFVQGRE